MAGYDTYAQSMLDLRAILPERPHSISRASYERMIEAGVFADQHIELLQGVLVETSPQGTRHMAVIRQLTTLFAGLAVARRALIHARTTYLVVEVAESSLAKDRGLKAELYAAASQPEYWVVDLATRRILVHTEPMQGQYARVHTVTDGDRIALTTLAGVSVAVADILPPT